MEIISAIRGFKDILPAEAGQWLFVEEQARRVFHAFGFRDIRIPILEKTELFARGIGETTDVVEKEMYTFTDRGEESLTLRPEATAGVVRAYIEHALYAAEPVARLYTIGPMFRRERPQKGRYRQFYQIDAEILGLDDARVDAELILMLTHFLKAVGLTSSHVEINSLGCPCAVPPSVGRGPPTCRGGRRALRDCRRRIQTNPLRVFDCKIESCRAAVEDAPRLADFLCDECRAHFGTVQESLGLFGVPSPSTTAWCRPGLLYPDHLRGDTRRPGRTDAVVGGGRYDGSCSSWEDRTSRESVSPSASSASCR
jgi:histidyl-tRNA synthetase